MQKLRIVYLIGELGKGGSERQLYLLLKAMDLSEVDPLVVCFNPSAAGGYEDAIRACGVPVLYCPPGARSAIARLRFVVKTLRAHQAQVVHSWSAYTNTYASLGGLLAGVPLRAGSMRNSLKNRGFLNLPRLARLLSIHGTPWMFVNAESIQAELAAEGLPRDRIFLVENCVEIPQTRPSIPPELAEVFAGGYRIVGTVCNIRRNKNVHIFIEGLAKLLPAHPELRGVIVGQPIPDELDYYDEIRQLIGKLGLMDSIYLLGFREDAPALSGLFDVFCLLSQFEGTPNALMEAMAAGRPVIATRTSGIPDLIRDGENGCLVEPGSVASFASALEQMLNRADLEALGAAGREKMKSEFYCPEKSAKFVNIYRELLGRQR